MFAVVIRGELLSELVLDLQLALFNLIPIHHLHLVEKIINIFFLQFGSLLNDHHILLNFFSHESENGLVVVDH